MDGNIILKFCSIVNTNNLYSQKVKSNLTRSPYMSGKHITVDIGWAAARTAHFSQWRETNSYSATFRKRIKVNFINRSQRMSAIVKSKGHISYWASGFLIFLFGLLTAAVKLDFKRDTNLYVNTFNSESKIGRHVVVLIARSALERVIAIHHLFTDG